MTSGTQNEATSLWFAVDFEVMCRVWNEDRQACRDEMMDYRWETLVQDHLVRLFGLTKNDAAGGKTKAVHKSAGE